MPPTPPEVYVVDEHTTEELSNETDSKEVDVNCSTEEASTSEYTIISILKPLPYFRIWSSHLGRCEGRGKGNKLFGSAEHERKGEKREQGGQPAIIHSVLQYRE